MTDGASYEARVTRVVRKYRRDLINRDHDAQKQFALQLREAHETLLRELDAARTAVEAARSRGVNENTFRLQRALDMAKQAEALLGQYAQNGTSYIANQQREVARTAYAAAQEFLDTTSPPPPGLPNASSFMTFPQEALEVITAATRSGPVAELLNRYGTDAAKAVGKVLTQAIVLGTNPTVVAKQLSNELAVPLWKGQQIARTEINRAYQESLRETWRQNKEITPKWIWRSGRTTTTCAVCWAMDGTEHDVEEPMGSHPSCRCSMVPAAISWDDLAAQFGIEMPEGDFEPPREMTGPEAFDLLSDDEKRSVLGPGKFRAYNAGEIRLEDLVRERRSDDWGLSRSEGSLERAKERAIARSSDGGSSGGGGAPPGGNDGAPERPWEEPGSRKRMPNDLQEIIGSPSDTVRVRDSIDLKIRTKHRRAIEAYERLTELLDDWQFYRESPGDVGVKWEVYVTHEGNWFLAVLGRDSGDSHTNLITLYPRRNAKVEELIRSREIKGRK